MKQAGIREARQNLTALIEEVRKGREITITDRGKPVARPVPPRRAEARTYSDRAAYRRKMPTLSFPLSEAVIDARSERD
jgi:prevent-host-death family protein